MTFTEEALKESYHFKDASDSEDLAVQQFLFALLDLPMKDTWSQRVFKRATPFFLGFVVLLCVFRGIMAGFHIGIVILPVMIIILYGIPQSKIYKQMWESSGIDYNYRKYSSHFLISIASCSDKSVRKGSLGRDICLVNAKVNGGGTLTEVPMIKPHYESVQPGSRVFLVAARKNEDFCFFAVPQSFFPSASKSGAGSRPGDELVDPKPRRMEKADCDLVLRLESERLRIRHDLYMKNQLIALGVLVIFIILQWFVGDNTTFTFAIAMLAIFGFLYLSTLAQDRGVRKALEKNEELLCVEATARPAKKGSRQAVFFTDSSDRHIFTSTLRDDVHWFASGGKALLVYYDKSKPIAYKIG